jgi:AcrR family transcriptional regulator/DNA-binding MarR family transcriptional regulator
VPAVQVAQIQRSRLLAGAVGAIEEHGCAHTTVAHITARSRVSRRTFYQLFENREACVIALLEEAVVGPLEEEIAAASLDDLAWRERVRGGLWAILCFLEREPALARVCVVQALQGGPRVLAYRERILARLVAELDRGREEGASRASDCTALTAEGLVGAAFGILYSRLAHGRPGPPTGLLGELMGMIVLPYLGVAAARRERARPTPAPPLPERAADTLAGRVAVERDPLENLPMRLTYRTARVLGGIASQPGASNREVSERAGIADQGQVSKLLRRLERLELVRNTGGGHAKGEPNAWELTAVGREVAQRISASTRGQEQAA